MRLFRIRKLVYTARYLPVGLIYIYKKLVSPLFPPTCRFYPSCSVYASLAFKKYGIIKGCFLSVKRISKCHPFHPGGYDPLT